MLQKVDQTRLDKVSGILKKLNPRFPLKVVTEKTGFDSGNVSAYLGGKKPMSDKFYTKFLQEFENTVSDEPSKEFEKSDLSDLIASNKVLIEGQMRLIEGQNKLIDTNADLKDMLKAMMPVIADDRKGILEDQNANLRGVVDAIAEVAMGKKFQSKEAAVLALSKTIYGAHKKAKQLGKTAEADR